MTEMYFDKPDRMMTYPSHHVCSIINDRDDASHALDSLIKSGVKEEDIEILYGREGIDLLDPKGINHGFFAKIARKFQSFGDMEKLLVHIYETALRHGAYIFIIPSYTEEEKESIRTALEVNNARELNYFSSWYVEAL